MKIARKTVVLALRLYQIMISPVLAAALGPSGRCRFSPTCSQYAREAVERHGVLIGGSLAVGRLCRCHPWGRWGEDPPPVGPIKLKLSWPKAGKSKVCHGS